MNPFATVANGAMPSVEPPVWLLDIDGVLGPTGRRSLETYSVLPGVGWQGSVAYIPTLVERIEALHYSGRVEIRWLTSWEDEANEAWAQIGFGPFRTLRSRDVPSGPRWWKTEHVRRVLAEGRRVIWTDDEIGDHLNLDAQNPHPERLLVACPTAHIGLSHSDLNRIEEWVASPSPR